MRRRGEDQDVHAQCLTLRTNAIIGWNTTYLSAALDHMDLPDSVAEHRAASMRRQSTATANTTSPPQRRLPREPCDR